MNVVPNVPVYIAMFLGSDSFLGSARVLDRYLTDNLSSQGHLYRVLDCVVQRDCGSKSRIIHIVAICSNED